MFGIGTMMSDEHQRAAEKSGAGWEVDQSYFLQLHWVISLAQLHCYQYSRWFLKVNLQKTISKIGNIFLSFAYRGTKSVYSVVLAVGRTWDAAWANEFDRKLNNMNCIADSTPHRSE